ncbi:MAG: M56 family metallopeptidase, partial [Verrucomicrobiota bacterium]
MIYLLGSSIQLLVLGLLYWAVHLIPALRMTSSQRCVFIVLIFGVTIFPENLVPVHLDLQTLSIADDSREALSGLLASLTGSPVSKALLVIWLAGILFIAFFEGLRSLKVHRSLIREPIETKSAVYESLETVKKRVGILVPISIHCSRLIPYPVLLGWLRPRIFFPERESDMSKDSLESILTHECVHIRRGDIFWHWVISFSALLFWFHPISWILIRRYLKDREIACDSSVLRTSDFSLDIYLNTLLEESRHQVDHARGATPFFSAGIVEQKSLIQSRIENLMKTEHTGKLSFLSTISLAALAVISSLALTSLRAEPDPEL